MRINSIRGHLVGRACRALFTRTGRLLEHVGQWLYQSAHDRELQRWARDRGDETLRLQYDLSPDSIVLDLGGYEGQWASNIHAMYGCRVLVCEPVAAFADQIMKRFRCNPKIEVYGLGLSGQTRAASLGMRAAGSSLFRPTAPQVAVKLVQAAEFFEQYALHNLALMKVNIEGGEYELLEHLLVANLIPTIRDIQVQFHDCVPDAIVRREQIAQRLSATHHLTYYYPFVWENWRRQK